MVSLPFAATAAIVASAGQLKREWEQIRDRQGNAKSTQISTAAAQARAYSNLGTDPTLTYKQLDAEIAAMSQRTGVSQEHLYAAASNAFSARGQLSGREALGSVEAAA